MKKEHVVEIFIWLFLILCGSIISFWAYSNFFADKNTHVLFFRDVDGIVVGSPVRFMGVVVGHVSDLEYKNGIINVKILITKKGVNFPKGSRAKVQFAGLAGSKSIEITPPKDDSIAYSVIMTDNPVRVKDIFEYSRSFTNALLSIESQIELISADSLYKVLQNTSVPYNWSNIDNMLYMTPKQKSEFHKKANELVEKEKRYTDQINRLNNLIKN